MDDLNTYVYIRRSGSGSTIRGDREFTAVGQRIDLSEESFKELVKGGGAFLPLDQFETINFDEADLVKFGPGYYGDFSPAFVEKCDLAAEMFRELYASVKAEELAVIVAAEHLK